MGYGPKGVTQQIEAQLFFVYFHATQQIEKKMCHGLALRPPGHQIGNYFDQILTIIVRR